MRQAPEYMYFTILLTLIPGLSTISAENSSLLRRQIEQLFSSKSSCSTLPCVQCFDKPKTRASYAQMCVTSATPEPCQICHPNLRIPRRKFLLSFHLKSHINILAHHKCPARRRKHEQQLAGCILPFDDRSPSPIGGRSRHAALEAGTLNLVLFSP
jgi:hypothetical protein